MMTSMVYLKGDNLSKKKTLSCFFIITEIKKHFPLVSPISYSIQVTIHGIL